MSDSVWPPKTHSTQLRDERLVVYEGGEAWIVGLPREVRQ